jgi:hypothetical protein
MRNVLLFAFSISLFQNISAQVPTAMPPDASAFYSDAMPVIRKQVKDLILQMAATMEHLKPNADSLSQKLHSNKALKGMSNNDIDGITVLILVQASRDVDADLKLLVLGMSRRNEQKQLQGNAMQTASENNTENKNKSSEETYILQNLKLKMIMERKSRMAEEVTNAMKKISNNQQSIINNLK